MTTTITAVDVHDVRFPTAAAGDGSDAINRGDYSATYVELRTDARRRPAPGSPSPTAGATRSPARRCGRWPTTCVGPHRRGDRRRAGGVLALAHRRRAAALARPGEGRHPHGDRRAGQRGLGPAGQAGRQAACGGCSPRCRPRSWSPASTSTTSPTRSPRTRRAAILDKGRVGLRRPAGRAGARRLPVVHHLGRLARLPRRQGAGADPRRRTPRAGGR